MHQYGRVDDAGQNQRPSGPPDSSTTLEAFQQLSPEQQRAHLLRQLKDNKVGFSDSSFSEFQKFIMRQAEENPLRLTS